MCSKTRLISFILCASIVIAQPAYGVATIAGVAVSGPAVVATAVAGTAGAAGGATVAVASSGWWSDLGLAVAVASVLVIVVDPPSGTFYHGNFAINFPAAFLEPVDSGWLGEWGNTPNDAAPPVDPSGGFPNGATFVIHSANPALTASVNNELIRGVQGVSFDWGLSGHGVTGPDHFNFYAALFRAKQDFFISYLGNGDKLMGDANLFTTNMGISCSPAGSSVIEQCGSPRTQFFSIAGVPEPSTWALMIGGLGLFGYAMRWRIRPTAG